MRYSSVASTAVLPRKPRRRLGFLVCIKCRRPALRRSTFPLAVILNRFATDFFVLMPFGRRINQFLLFKKSAQYMYARRDAQEIFRQILLSSTKAAFHGISHRLELIRGSDCLPVMNKTFCGCFWSKPALA